MRKQKKLLIIVIAIVVVLLLVIIMAKKQKPLGETTPDGTSSVDLKNMPVAPEINVKKISKPKEVVSGGSLVDNNGIVVTDNGEATKTGNVIPNSPQAPKQSKVLAQEEIPESGIKISVNSEKGFIPSKFKVKPGQVVTIVLTATDSQEYTLRFKDASLRAVAISVKGGQTKAVTFNAPNNVGVYDFICSNPDHRDKGKGQMIVAQE